MEAVLCIDLGGTKSAASLVTRDGDIRFRTAAKTPGIAAADDLASFLISLGKTVLAETFMKPIGIGVSVGGPTDARRGEAWAAPALPGWGNGYPLASVLSDAFNGITVRLENDADATALAEQHRLPAVLINPAVEWASPETRKGEEGCLSVPGIYDGVERPVAVRVRALDEHGVERTIEAEGLLAVCIQHEMDHLMGKVFVEYLSPLKRTRIKSKMVKAQREAMKA